MFSKWVKIFLVSLLGVFLLSPLTAVAQEVDSEQVIQRDSSVQMIQSDSLQVDVNNMVVSKVGVDSLELQTVVDEEYKGDKKIDENGEDVVVEGGEELDIVVDGEEELKIESKQGVQEGELQDKSGEQKPQGIGGGDFTEEEKKKLQRLLDKQAKKQRRELEKLEKRRIRAEQREKKAPVRVGMDYTVGFTVDVGRRYALDAPDPVADSLRAMAIDIQLDTLRKILIAIEHDSILLHTFEIDGVIQYVLPSTVDETVSTMDTITIDRPILLIPINRFKQTVSTDSLVVDTTIIESLTKQILTDSLKQTISTDSLVQIVATDTLVVDTVTTKKLVRQTIKDNIEQAIFEGVDTIKIDRPTILISKYHLEQTIQTDSLVVDTVKIDSLTQPIQTSNIIQEILAAMDTIAKNNSVQQIQTDSLMQIVATDTLVVDTVATKNLAQLTPTDDTKKNLAQLEQIDSLEHSVRTVVDTIVINRPTLLIPTDTLGQAITDSMVVDTIQMDKPILFIPDNMVVDTIIIESPAQTTAMDSLIVDTLTVASTTQVIEKDDLGKLTPKSSSVVDSLVTDGLEQEISTYLLKKETIERVIDSLILERRSIILVSEVAKRDSINKALKYSHLLDSLTQIALRPRHNAVFRDSMSFTAVTALSVVIPGFAQLYNSDYWKIPTGYVAIGVPLLFGFQQNKLYKKYKTEYDILNSNKATQAEKTPSQTKMIKHNTYQTLLFGTAAVAYMSLLADGIVNYPSDMSRIQKATALSMVFPGAGQVFNGNYWKLPIIVGGGMTLIYVIDWNSRGYTRFEEAYEWRTDGDPNTDDESLLRYSEADLTRLKSSYRRNRDLAIIGLVGCYLLQIADAHIGAHLRDYDISDDLSFDIEPNIQNNHSLSRGSSNSFGLSMNIYF